MTDEPKISEAAKREAKRLLLDGVLKHCAKDEDIFAAFIQQVSDACREAVPDYAPDFSPLAKFILPDDPEPDPLEEALIAVGECFDARPSMKSFCGGLHAELDRRGYEVRRKENAG